MEQRFPRENSGLHTLKDAWEQANPPRVLLAEDDDELRFLLASGLREDGFDVVEAGSGSELLALIASHVLRPERPGRLDVIISDLAMPGATGLDALAELRGTDRSTPAIIITGFGGPRERAAAAELGAAAFLDKPFDLDALRALARRLTDGALDE